MQDSRGAAGHAVRNGFAAVWSGAGSPLRTFTTIPPVPKTRAWPCLP
jgi:hypothetical protein